MAKRAFSKRLQQLRLEKGVDPWTMSQELGMTRNYIFNIEADYAYPSMTNFFAICEYFDITPSKFLEIEPETTGKQDDLMEAVKGLDDAGMDQLIALAKQLNNK